MKYKGQRWDDVAITEIYFDGLDVHCFAGGGLSKGLNDKNELVNIEDLKKGDKVLTKDIETGEVYKDRIEEMVSVKHCGLIKITTKNNIEIFCTKDHPFMDSENE